MSHYVVTGGCGFIGSHITHALVSRGHTVVVIDNLYSGFKSYLPKEGDVTLVEADISDWAALSQKFAYFQNFDGVFHCAAIARIQPSIYDPTTTHKYNVEGTLNVLQMMRMCNIPSIVYSASSSYYGKQERLPFREDDTQKCETPYAITKYMGELYCKTWGKLYGIKNASLKYFNVYGRRSPLAGNYAPVIGIFFRQAFTGSPITIIGDGSQSRDFTHVDDVVHANLLAMFKLNSSKSNELSGLTLNVGTETNYTILDVANKVCDCMKAFNPKISYVPERIGETQATLADISLARTILNWEPTITLDEGIADLKQYYISNLEKIQKGDMEL